MSMHLHGSRHWTAWGLAVAAMSPLAFCWDNSGTDGPLSPVTGRVMLLGRPAGSVTICLDSDGRHVAYGLTEADGSFRLRDMSLGEIGAHPGRYRAHFCTHDKGPYIPPRYADPSTADVEIVVASGWNEFHIDLP